MSWEKEHYRFCESLLNDFRNKRLSYSEFIDRDKQFIKDLLDKQREEVTKSLSTWIDGNIGMSSEAIYLYMTTGKIPTSFEAPYDSSDRGRCIALLKCVPEWIPRLKEIEDMNLKIHNMTTGMTEYPWNKQIPLILSEFKNKEGKE